MPDLNSNVITSDYLLNVALSRCYNILKEKVSIGQLFKKISKITLFNELEKICNTQNIILGFTSDKLPDKKWLTNILYTLNKENDIFQKFLDSDKVQGLTRDDLSLLKSLDTSLGRKKNLKFFKRTHQQVEEKRNQIAKSKLQSIKLKLQRKKIESDKIEQRIRAYQQKLAVAQQSQQQQQIPDAPLFKKQQKQ